MLLIFFVLFCPLLSASAQKLNVYSILNEPYLIANNKINTGFNIDLIEALIATQKIPASSYELNFEDRYGMQFENGTWTGIVGTIAKKSASELAIGLADLTVTEKRKSVVDFSNPFKTGGIVLLMKKSDVVEKTSSYDCWWLLKPFSLKTWIVIIIMKFLTFLVLFGISYSQNKTSECRERIVTNFYQACEYLWIVPGLKAKSFAVKVASWAWFVFLFFFVVCYMAMLINTPLNKMSYVSGKLEHMINSNKIRYFAMESGAIWQFFQKGGTDLTKKISMKMLEDKKDGLKLPKSRVEGLEMVIKGPNNAFFLESAGAEYLTSLNCELLIIGPYLNKIDYAIIVNKKNPKLLKSINDGLDEVKKSGTLKKLIKKWFGREKCARKERAKENERRFESITLGNFILPIAFLIFGLLIAIITAIVEWICCGKKREEKNETDI